MKIKILPNWTDDPSVSVPLTSVANVFDRAFASIDAIPPVSHDEFAETVETQRVMRNFLASESEPTNK